MKHKIESFFHFNVTDDTEKGLLKFQKINVKKLSSHIGKVLNVNTGNLLITKA
jgi:hypothetical protein